MRFPPGASNGARRAHSHAAPAPSALLRNNPILDERSAHRSGAIFVSHMCQVFGPEIAKRRAEPDWERSVPNHKERLP